MVLPEIGPVEESVPVAKGISMGGAGCVYDSVPRCLQIWGRVDGKVGKGDAVKKKERLVLVASLSFFCFKNCC